jgi:hypothetical protein
MDQSGTVIVPCCPLALSRVSAHVARCLPVIGCLPIFKIHVWPLIPGTDCRTPGPPRDCFLASAQTRVLKHNTLTVSPITLFSADHVYECVKHRFFVVICTVYRVNFKILDEIRSGIENLLETT